MTTNDILKLTYDAFKAASPLRTGQLRDSAEDPGVLTNREMLPDGQVGFQLFGRNGQGYYGSILNEAQQIRYRMRDRVTGKIVWGQYTNRHYMYVDNFFEGWANSLPLLVPGLRRIA